MCRAGDGPTHCMENVGAADAGLFIANGGGDGAVLAEGAGGSGVGAEELVATLGEAEEASEALDARTVLEASGCAVVWPIGVDWGDEQPHRSAPAKGHEKRLLSTMTGHGDMKAGRSASFWEDVRNCKDSWSLELGLFARGRSGRSKLRTSVTSALLVEHRARGAIAKFLENAAYRRCCSGIPLTNYRPSRLQG